MGSSMPAPLLPEEEVEEALEPDDPVLEADDPEPEPVLLALGEPAVKVPLVPEPPEEPVEPATPPAPPVPAAAGTVTSVGAGPVAGWVAAAS